MRCVIAGGRKITDVEVVIDAILRSGWADQITEVVCGDAEGVDSIGNDWADAMGIPVKHFPVTKEEWRRLGKKAGPLRNNAMAAYADALILVWDGQSDGSRSMRTAAIKARIRIRSYIYRDGTLRRDMSKG